MDTGNFTPPANIFLELAQSSQAPSHHLSTRSTSPASSSPSSRAPTHTPAKLSTFSSPRLSPLPGAKLYTLKELTQQYPTKIICVFPETTTTNGRGILPLSPSLLSADGTTKIYPVNLRYTPQDITTPVPGGYVSWLWKLLHKPTHQMRVRIASRIYNSSTQDSPKPSPVATTLTSSTSLLSKITTRVTMGGAQ
jgi:hypothetical protein